MSVIMLNVIMLNAIMLNVIMLNVIILNVNLLGVMAQLLLNEVVFYSDTCKARAYLSIRLG
jgi:hypothetical protein